MLFSGGLMMAGERRLKRYRARLMPGTGGAGGYDGSQAGQQGGNAQPLQLEFNAFQGDLAQIVIGKRGRGGKGRAARTEPDARFDFSAPAGGEGWRRGGKGGSPGTVGQAGYGGGGGGSTALLVAGVLTGVAGGSPGGKGVNAAGTTLGGDGAGQDQIGTYADEGGAGQSGQSPPAGQEGSGSGGGGGGHDKGGNAGTYGAGDSTPAGTSRMGNSYIAASALPYTGTSNLTVFSGTGVGGQPSGATGDGSDGQDGRVVIEDVETGQVYVYDADTSLALP